MKRTIAITAGIALTGLLSMGLLGGLLYYAAYPVLAPLYGDIDDWSGDDVWPATIMAGMLWALAVPVAAMLSRRLADRGVRRALRWTGALAAMWIGAAIAWMLVLTMTDVRIAVG